MSQRPGHFSPYAGTSRIHTGETAYQNRKYSVQNLRTKDGFIGPRSIYSGIKKEAEKQFSRQEVLLKAIRFLTAG